VLSSKRKYSILYSERGRTSEEDELRADEFNLSIVSLAFSPRLFI
jgi:hypothetical protein